MSNIEGEQMSLNLSFVDRVEEKLTSPDREKLSLAKKTSGTLPQETVEEDFNGNVTDQGFSEKLKETIGNKSVEDSNSVLQVTEHGNKQEKNDTETFIDRQETYLPFDLNQGQDLKIDMEGRKNKSSDASFQWYEDQSRRDKMYENKVDVAFSDKNDETERISSQLLDKTKEMYYMDSKKEIDDKNKTVVATDDGKLFHSERFEMYNSINQIKTSSSKVDDTLPEAIQHYGSLEAGAYIPETSVDSTQNLNIKENKIQAVSTKSTEQIVDSTTKKVESVNYKEKGTTFEELSGKSPTMEAPNQNEDENLIFEEDEENVIIHFSSEFSQDQQGGVVEGAEQKQEVMYQQQEVVTEMGKTVKKQETTKVTAKNELEIIPPVPTIEIERKFKVMSDSLDKLVKLGATLLKERIFTDRYYDNDNYSLTLADAWLRQRNETWELKLGRQLSEKAGLPTQYNEISNEKEIAQFLVKHFKMDSSLQNMPVPDLLKKLGLVEFAVFTTTRQSYGLPDCTIDLDLTDFGFQVGEIEVMVIDESHIPSALDTITDVANKLG